MAKDFRASQIQTTQIIASGSSGTNARIVVYPVEKQSGVAPNQGIIDPTKFGTGSIGTDIFVYVSGGINERNTSNNSITVFGGDVHISGNLTSDQQIFGEGSLFRLEVVDFATTEQTGSNPEVVGQVIFPATEFTGSSLTLRAILSNTEVSGVAAIKLFNLTDLAFVEIAGPSQEELSVTGSTPTLVESVNLISASGFNTSSVGLYELHLFSSTGSNTAQVGGGELRPSGSFSGLTIVSSSTVIISGTWVDDNNRLRTTASVAIDSDGNFANEIGSNVYFYVSGTINSWTTASFLPEKNHAVFGGDVRVSGSFIGGGNNEIFDDWPGGSTGSNTQFNFIAGGQNNIITPFTNGQESLGSGQTNRNFIGAGLGNSITQSNNSGIVTGRHNQIGEGILSGAFIGGGTGNAVGANDAAVVAGWENSAQGDRSFIGAGFNNFASAEDSVVVGGEQNGIAVGARYSAIVAGFANNITNDEVASFIGAGQFNTVDGDQSAIVAGYNNNIDNDAQNSFIGAGQNNNMNNVGVSRWQAILVGSGNQIQGFSNEATNYSVILGGQSNTVRVSSALVYGDNLTLQNPGDAYTVIFGSSATGTASYRFVVSASRGSVFHGGLSGSLTTLTDGSPYLIAGTNITLATGANGAVTITSTGGGGGGDSFFFSPTTGSVVTTGSLNVSGSLIAGKSGSINPQVNSVMRGSAIIAVAGVTASISSSEASGQARGYASAIVAGEDVSINDAATSAIVASYASKIRLTDTSSLFRTNQAAIVGGFFADINDAANSVIVGGTYNTMSGTLFENSGMGIFAGTRNGVSHSAYSAIVGGWGNSVRKTEQSALLGGLDNVLRGREAQVQFNAAIVGGEQNYVGTYIESNGNQTGQSSWSVVAGGFNNQIRNGWSSFIGGGENNEIFGPGNALEGGDAIIAGDGNVIASSSYSVVLGSFGSTLRSSDRSVIIGGNSNTISGTNQIRNVVIGSNWTVANEDNVYTFGDATTATARVLISGSGGVRVTGQTVFASGLSGSLTRLANGSPYLVAGSNITLTTGSGGEITIASAGGGGSDADWVDGGGQIRTTSSVAVSSLSEFATNRGADVYFFVSGTFGSGSASDRVAVFGGDVRISGTLAVGTGSVFIKDDSIFFGSASIRNVGGQLQFFDSDNLTGQTLQQLASGSGGGGQTTLQQAYNLDNVVTTSVGSGSFTLVANDITHSPFVVSASSHSNTNPPILDVRTGTDSPVVFRVVDTANKEFVTLEKIGNFDSRINMRSEGSFNISYGWLNNTSAGIGLNSNSIWFQNSNGNSFQFVGTSGVTLMTLTPQASFDASQISTQVKFIQGADMQITGNLGVTDTIRARGGLAVDPGANISETTYGTDAIMVVSGVVGGRGTTANSTALFLGDVHISGNLSVNGTAPGGGSSFFFSDTANIVEQSGSLEMSGSGLFKSGLTGALNVLPDGSPYLIAGTNITLSTGSSGAVTINSTGTGGSSTTSTGSVIAFGITDYATTNSTSSNPQAIGQLIFDPTEYTGSITLRTVLATTTGSVTASVRLFNVTSGSLVHIGGVGVTELETTNETPTIVESVNLRTATNFTNGRAIYELQSFITTGSQTAFVGAAEFRLTGSATVPPTRLGLGSYTLSTATSSNPQAVGGGYFVPSEHNVNSSVFRAILSTTTASNTAFVQLYNITSGALVHVGGAGITELSSSATSPTTVESVDLFTATNFNPSSAAIYEVRVYGSGSASPATTIINSELVCF